jgi:hypothetical protein
MKVDLLRVRPLSEYVNLEAKRGPTLTRTLQERERRLRRQMKSASVSMLAFFLKLLVCSMGETSLAQLEPQAVSRTTIPRAELVYDRPADTPDAGQPIGNGRMGTMVWASPDAVQLQINRADVFPVNRDHVGQWGGATDYCGGIARSRFR